MIDRGIQTKNKTFMVGFFKLGLFDHLVNLACFEKSSSDLRRGENLFADNDNLEKRVAGDFYLRLRETLADWNAKFGVDRTGKVTKFRIGFEKAFEGASDKGIDKLHRPSAGEVYRQQKQR